MDIEDLETFVEVAISGGVSPAARRLGVAKSIVSRRLAKLEADLGIQLLARTTRGASLTEAGATFRDYAARICTEMDAARETILPSGQLRGRLRIATPLSLGPTLFVPVIAELAKKNPLLQVQTSYSERHVDIVGEGFDCAIRIGNLQDSSLSARRIGSLRGKLVASPDYIKQFGSPATPDELLSHEALMQGNESWQFLDGEQVIPTHPQGRFKAANGAALAVAAVAGLGIAYLPDVLADQHISSGALVEVMTRYSPMTVGMYVVRPSGAQPPRKVRVLTEMLIERFGA